MKSTAALPLLVCGLLACSGVGESADSTTIVPVEDINARDTTPPAPPPQVSRLTLMDSLPAGGFCNVRRYPRGSDQAAEVRYEVLSPYRSYVIEVGKPPRAFGAVSLDIRGTRSSDELTETENVFVGFSADGKVTLGTRRYSATGSITANDREPLKMGDSAIALDFARKILDLCGRGL